MQVYKFTNSLHILYNSPLHISFPNIYSQSVASYSLDNVFHRAEFKILIKSSLPIISFMDYDIVSKKSLPYPKSSTSFSCVIF